MHSPSLPYLQYFLKGEKLAGKDLLLLIGPREREGSGVITAPSFRMLSTTTKLSKYSHTHNNL